MVPLPGVTSSVESVMSDGIGVIHRLRHDGAHGVERGRARARDEQRRTAADDFGGDRGDLSGRLAEAEDDFRKPLTDAAMMIDAGEPEILERPSAQRLRSDASARGVGGDLAARHLHQQILEPFV